MNVELVLFCIVFCAVIISKKIIKIVTQMWRFCKIANEIVELYCNVFKIIIQVNFNEKKPYDILYGRWNLIFANTDEANMAFEEIINDVLKEYVAIRCRFIFLKNKKKELEKIRDELRKLRNDNKK